MGHTKQRLADRIKQHVPKSIRKKSNTAKEQPPRICKNKKFKINYESAIGQHLIANPECAKTYTDNNFRIIGKQDHLFNYVFWNLFTSRLKTQSCVDKKSSFSHWDSSSKQWLIGPNWPFLGPIRHILSHVTTSGYIFRLPFRSLSDVFIL